MLCLCQFFVQLRSQHDAINPYYTNPPLSSVGAIADFKFALWRDGGHRSNGRLILRRAPPTRVDVKEAPA